MTLNLDKSNWKHVTLGDVVNASKEKCDPGSGVIERYVAGEHMDTDDLKIHRWGVVGDGYLGPAFHRRFRPGQVLYGSRRTYLRKVAVPDFDGICANTTFVVETRDKNVLLQEFLPFIMTGERFHAFAIAESKGSVNPYVNWSDIARYQLLLPPLDDQNRLAGLLWAAERHRQRLRTEDSELTAAYEAWLKGRLARLPTLRLDCVVQLQQGRLVPSSLYGDDGVPLLRPGDMKSDGVTAWTGSTVRVPASYAKDSSRWILSPGDLVINMTAQSLEDRFLGRVCRVHDMAVLNQRIGRLLLSPGVNAKFLHVVLRDPAFSGWVARKSEGSKVKHMHWRHIQDYPLPLPDPATQECIAEEAEGWLEAHGAIIEEIRKVTTLAHAISSRVFGTCREPV